MQVKLRLQSVFFIIQEFHIKLVKYMMVLLQWTGWSKSRSVVLQLLQLRLLVNGNFLQKTDFQQVMLKVIILILLILLVTLILQLK